MLDNLAAGTVEVGTNMDSSKKLKLVDVVRAFVLGSGDPYFAAYNKKNGHLSLNRFNDIHVPLRGIRLKEEFSPPSWKNAKRVHPLAHWCAHTGMMTSGAAPGGAPDVTATVYIAT